MGGDSNPWCLAAHTLSRRAQSTALSPILRSAVIAAATETRLKLQSTKQFVERELQADIEFAEFAVIGAYRIEAHLVDDGFNLKRVLGKKRDAPLGIVESGRPGDKLFHFPGVLPTDGAVPEHELAAI